MDELNKWHSHPDYPEEEALAYMYRQQEEEHAGMQQQHHFAERQHEQQQYYTSPPPMAPPRSPSPFLEFFPHHHQHHSSGFPGFGVPAFPPRPLPLGPVKNEPGQPSSSSNRILSFGGAAGQTPSTLNFSSSGGDWLEAGVEAVQQMPSERRNRTHWNTQEHVIAERKRREKMQQQFVALATIVPDLTKCTSKADWVRGDIVGFEEEGVEVNRRARGVPKGGPGHHELVEADMAILATGFHRPSLSFLPEDCFREPYEPPNWYLQTFPPQHPSLSAINCTYISGIGSVGNWHIGIYTRILLMFLVDPLSRPSPFWMCRWIDMTRFLKLTSPIGAFDFFTYLELIWWFVFCVAFNPFRWKWAVFVFFGVGMGPPKALVGKEKKLLDSTGYERRDQGRSI